jgi:hypothetical protein
VTQTTPMFRAKSSTILLGFDIGREFACLQQIIASGHNIFGGVCLDVVVRNKINILSIPFKMWRLK